MILAPELYFSFFYSLSFLHWFQSELKKRKSFYPGGPSRRYVHTQTGSQRGRASLLLQQCPIALALDVAWPSVIHHLLPASSWGTGAALATALRNQLKQGGPCQCCLLLSALMCACARSFSMWLTSLRSISLLHSPLWYLIYQAADNGFGQTLHFILFHPFLSLFFFVRHLHPSFMADADRDARTNPTWWFGTSWVILVSLSTCWVIANSFFQARFYCFDQPVRLFFFFFNLLLYPINKLCNAQTALLSSPAVRSILTLPST